MSGISPSLVSFCPSVGLQVEGALPGLRRLWASKAEKHRYTRPDVPESQRGEPGYRPAGYVYSSPLSRWASVPGKPEGEAPESMYQRLVWSDLAAAAYAGVDGPGVVAAPYDWLQCGSGAAALEGPEDAARDGGETWAAWMPGSVDVQAVTLAGWPEAIPLRWWTVSPSDSWASVPKGTVEAILEQVGIPVSNDGPAAGPLAPILAGIPVGGLLLVPSDALPDPAALRAGGLYAYALAPDGTGFPSYSLVARATDAATSTGGVLRWGQGPRWVPAAQIPQVKQSAERGDRRLARRAAWFLAGCPLTGPVRSVLGTPSRRPVATAARLLSLRKDKGDGALVVALADRP